MDLGLRDRVALIGGGSMGIGKASALALAREGAHVAICARGKDLLEQAAGDIAAETDREVLPIVTDLTREGDAENFVHTAAGAALRPRGHTGELCRELPRRQPPESKRSRLDAEPQPQVHGIPTHRQEGNTLHEGARLGPHNQRNRQRRPSRAYYTTLFQQTPAGVIAPRMSC